MAETFLHEGKLVKKKSLIEDGASKAQALAIGVPIAVKAMACLRKTRSSPNNLTTKDKAHVRPRMRSSSTQCLGLTCGISGGRASSQ